MTDDEAALLAGVAYVVFYLLIALRVAHDAALIQRAWVEYTNLSVSYR